MPEGEGKLSPQIAESGFKLLFTKLRKRRIIETLAAFIGGGWLLLEFVHWILVDHYHFPEKTIDITFVTILGALLSTLVWRWFGGTDKRPGNIKVEVLLVPLIILATIVVDLIILLEILGILGKTLLIAAVAVCLGIAWIILKSLQWAAAAPTSSSGLVQKPIESSSLAEIFPEKSIVVLPFADMSPQKDQEYFCDGMTEEIIADLSHVHELLVISRSSAMTFKGSSKTVRDIAKDLNIHYVMEGSVRKAGNDLRITAQLIDAANDAHIWAEMYSGTLDNVFDIQEKVSRAIVGALKMKLAPDEDRRIAERPLTNVPAYECYLKAYAEIWKCQEDSLNLAIRHLQHGLEIIGDNALLYSGLAYAFWQSVNIGLMQEEGLQKAEEYVKKALAIDPDCSKAHAVLGWINHLGGNTRESVDQFKRALVINPDDPFALQGLLGVYVAIVGKITAAIPLLERLKKIDPLDFVTNFFQTGLYLYAGDFNRALQAAIKLQKDFSENLYGQFEFALILAYNNEIDKSFGIIDKITKAGPDTILAKLGLILKYGILKEKERASQLMTPDFRKTCLRDPTFCHHLASIFSLLNEKNEALDWLERAINAGFINYPLLAEKDPWLANIRGEERFQKLMERVKYEWEHFEE